jgi:hypothetical protein
LLAHFISAAVRDKGNQQTPQADGEGTAQIWGEAGIIWKNRQHTQKEDGSFMCHHIEF